MPRQQARGGSRSRDPSSAPAPAAPTGARGGPANGRHYYLAADAGNRTGLLPGVDVRGRGGYVVGAGSLHPTGVEYEWEIPPWELAPAPAPPKLAALLARRSAAVAAVPSGVIPRGTRNATLFRLACGLRGRQGLGYAEVFASIGEVNRLRCDPPLDVREVERIARSASAYASAPEWVTDPVAFARDPLLRPCERQLLMILIHYANDEGVCWPGVRSLRADTRLATDTIQHATAGLAAAARIEVERRPRQSHLYRLLPKPDRTLKSITAQESGSSVLDGRTGKGGAAV